MRRKIIAVIGGSQPDENSLKIAEKAFEVITEILFERYKPEVL